MSNMIGGDKFIAALNAFVEAAQSASGRVGFLEGATYPDGTSVPLVAAANEYGTATAPPRPFMRAAIPAIKEKMELAAPLLKANDGDTRRTLSQILELAKGDIIESINSNIPPPNAPSTEERKGFNRTLIETGHLKNSVDWELDGD